MRHSPRKSFLNRFRFNPSFRLGTVNLSPLFVAARDFLKKINFAAKEQFDQGTKNPRAA
jgi:hypothetical protein